MGLLSPLGFWPTLLPVTNIIELGSIINNRYVLQSLLGAGGMGTVYLALDKLQGLEVALKFPISSRDKKDRSSFLRREFEVLNSLSHTSIPKVFEFSKSESGLNYFSMELVKGETLSSLVARQDLPDIAIRKIWLEQIIDTLAYVHSKSYLYCDLKPENIMIHPHDAGGFEVKLLDFGITVPLSDGLKASDLEARGTTEYMSPEQHMGSRLDQRSDIYSFGILAYELLTGQRPYQIEKPVDNEVTRNLKFSAMHANASVPIAHFANPAVPKDLSTVVEICMQKRRADRFANSKELASCLMAADGSSFLGQIVKGLKRVFFRSPAPAPNELSER